MRGATRQSSPSSTAQAAAAVRALESLLPADRRLFEDPHAANFLEPWHRGLLRVCRTVPPFRDWLEWALDRAYPGVPGDFICRTRYIDDRIRESMRERSFDRFVVLGAGYDTRAWRLPVVQGVRVTEVDHPATQARKKSVSTDLASLRSARIDWVAHDLSASPAAMNTAFDARERIFWLLEGVTGYLSRENTSALLAWLAERSSPGSAVVLTYVHRDWVEGEPEDPSARTILRSLRRRGEPFVGGWTPETLAGECARHGIRIEEDLTEVECAGLYPDLAERRLRFLSGFRIARGRL